MKSTLYPNIARQIKTTQIYMHDKFIYWCAECGVGGAIHFCVMILIPKSIYNFCLVNNINRISLKINLNVVTQMILPKKRITDFIRRTWFLIN